MRRSFKLALFTTALMLSISVLSAQTSKGRCGIEVVDVSCVQLLGYLTSYAVTFKNTTERTIDGIYFRVVFYNNEGRRISESEEAFNSSTWVDPIGPGTTKVIVRSPNIKGASKAVVVVDRAHFVNGESCR